MVPKFAEETDKKKKKKKKKGKGDTPKVVELVETANVLGMVTYQDDLLLVYESEHFSPTCHRSSDFFCSPRPWLFRGPSWQPRPLKLLHRVGAQSRSVRASRTAPPAILGRIHRGPQHRYGQAVPDGGSSGSATLALRSDGRAIACWRHDRRY
jgi:hypothetical protein